MRKWLLGAILVLAFLLRVIGISRYPIGFTPDEASFGYDAYSILKTGKDQWGEVFPIAFRSFGDFKLPLLVYLTIPSVALFGLNEFAIRLPNAIFGTIAVFVVYLLSLELAKNDFLKFNAKKWGLLAAFLLAISPWHFPFSRGAFEANLTTLLAPLGILLFYKGLKKPNYMITSVVAFSGNMFSAHSARLFTPVLVIILIALNFTNINRGREILGKYRWASILMLFTFFMCGYLILGESGSRNKDIAIYNPTDNWKSVVDRRFEADKAGLPDLISRLYSNKLNYTVAQFTSSYLSYFSPQYLFTNGAGEWTYGMIPGRGVLYLFEVVFLLFALYSYARKPKSKILRLLIFWLLLSPIPAALSKGPGFAGSRLAVALPALQLFSAYGFCLFLDFLQRIKRVQIGRLSQLGIVVIILVSFFSFIEEYFFHSPAQAAEGMLYGRREAIEFVQAIEGNYDKIIVSRRLSEPHIYVAFFKVWNPTDYQKYSPDWIRYEQEGRSFLDQLGTYSLGKYEFSDIKFSDRETEKGILLVGKPDEFPKDVKTLKTVFYPKGDKAILIVDPSQVSYANH